MFMNKHYYYYFLIHQLRSLHPRTIYEVLIFWLYVLIIRTYSAIPFCSTSVFSTIFEGIALRIYQDSPRLKLNMVKYGLLSSRQYCWKLLVPGWYMSHAYNLNRNSRGVGWSEISYYWRRIWGIPTYIHLFEAYTLSTWNPCNQGRGHR